MSRRRRTGPVSGPAIGICTFGIAAAVALIGASGVAAQMDGCEFGDGGRNDGFRNPLPGGAVWYFGAPHWVCDDGSQIFADSSITYEARDMHHLIGNVRYFGEGRTLRADELRYFSGVGRMQATGNVSLEDEEGGSTIRNGDLVLLLTTPTREEEEMTVVTGPDGVRPVAIITPPARPVLEEVPVDTTESRAATAESATAEEVPPALGPTEEAEADTIPPTPYTVVGDRMFLRGSGYFTAAGVVEIVRDSLLAWADSAEYGREDGGLHLAGSARVESASYELLGETITMGAPGAETSEIHARRSARLLGDQLELTSAQIIMVLQDDALERLVAIPLPEEGSEPDSVAAERPVAIVDEFVLRADSLEVNTPGERVERVFAAGRARSQSASGDSLNVEILPDVARSDWLEGDTIIVTFVNDPGRARVEGEEDEITVDQIVARVSASSLYRLAPNDTTARLGTDPPAVHYVTGGEIRILMAAGEVSRMHVIGQTRGVHLEPLSRQAAPADTATIVDSTRVDSVMVDTLTVDTLTASGRRAGEDNEGDDPPEHADTVLATEEVPWMRHSIR